MDEYESQIAELKQQIASTEKELVRNERHRNRALDQITECHVGVELSILLLLLMLGSLSWTHRMHRMLNRCGKQSSSC